MRNGWWTKSLVLGIILLFVGTSIVPGTRSSFDENTINNSRSCNEISSEKTVLNVNQDSPKTFGLTDGLICYWTFDEGSGDILHDSSGNGNDGYIYNCPWVAGHSGTALEFSNLDSIVYGLPDSLDHQITDYLSIEAWVKWYGPYSSFPQHDIFDCRDYWGGFHFFITNDSKLGFGYYASSDNRQYIYSDSDIPLNTWTHVEAVFDDTSHSMSLYINNKLDTTRAITYPYQISYSFGAIGNNHWASIDGEWRPFHGIIDELKIWRFKNQPPGAPSIKGPTSGKAKIASQWNFKAVDPDNNDVFYQIDWGDGNVSVWYGPYHSGEVMAQSHAYAFEGKYTIKSKAKDIYGDESNWTTLTVRMPYSYNKPIPQFLELLFQRFPHAFPILRHMLGY